MRPWTFYQFETHEHMEAAYVSAWVDDNLAVARSWLHDSYQTYMYSVMLTFADALTVISYLCTATLEYAGRGIYRVKVVRWQSLIAGAWPAVAVTLEAEIDSDRGILAIVD